MPLQNTAWALILSFPLFASDIPTQNDNLVSHEWGTFTSVAAADGSPVQWAPLSGPGDLPCFVDRLSPKNLKYVPGLVRMETPVLYFYSPRPLTVSVHVEFPQGLITEWFPQASRVSPASPDTITTLWKGRIDWDSVEVSPGDQSTLPSTQGASRYYEARNTESAPLRIGLQHEKMIFYRGVGNIPIPLRPTFTSDGRVDIRNISPDLLSVVVLFEKRNGKIGYQVARNVQAFVTLGPPKLTGNVEELVRELTGDLMESGLYRKEALAMINTWRDSWFEDGMRIFYVVPRAQIDAQLPVLIMPAPSEIQRAFVGRIEILSPAVRDVLETGLAQEDIAGLAKWGRFLSPFLSQIEHSSGKPLPPTIVQKVNRQIQQEFDHARCIE